jgi:hypothetical protein
MVAAVQSSWSRRGEKGQLSPVLLATLPLTAKAAEEQALCLNSVVMQPETAGAGASYLLVLILMVMPFIISYYNII